MKQLWADDWQYQPYAVPRRYTYGCAPLVSRADLQFDFGYIQQPDVVNATPFDTLFVPYNPGPWYVAIATQRQGFALDVHWVGTLVEDDVTVDRPGVSSGRQQLTAFGFEHALDRCFITKSYVAQNNFAGVISHVLPFNERSVRGGPTTGNRSTITDAAGLYRFFDPVSGDVPSFWTNLQIANYLLYYFVNTLPDGSASPVQFLLAGQAEVIDQIVDTFDFRPQDRPVSVWRALNQLIDRRRGLGFVLRSSGLPGAPIYIWVFTHVEAPIAAGNVILPANAEQIFFAIPTTQPYAHLVSEIPFRYSATTLFTSIEVQGEPIRVTGSFRKRQGTLDIGWTSSLETAYENTDDAGRSNDKFRGVYTYFVVPPDWDWVVYDPGDNPHNLLLTAYPDGTIGAERNPVTIGYNFMKVFERDLPLLEGYDYRVFPPTNENPGSLPAEYQKLVVLLPLESQTPARSYTTSDTFYFAEKGSEQEDEMPNCTVRGLDHTMGVEVKASPNYLIAMNRFAPASGHEGDDDPLVDYDSMTVTASIYCDVRPHVILHGIAIPSPELQPRLTVILPDCHFWYVAPFTEYDVDPDTGIPRVTSPENVVVRDDTWRLSQVAAYLRWWFSRLRQAVTITIHLPGQYAQPGMLLTQISTVWTREPVNAIITAREVDFEHGSTKLTTSYLDLDSMISLLDDPQRRIRRAGGRRGRG
jgi:hypothetical protein